MNLDWQPLALTFQLAGITTAVLLLIGIPLGYLLASWENRWKYVLQTLVSMPLVLPPTVLGFYLLLAFSPTGAFGQFLENTFDLRLVFSFEGLVIASIIYSLPFMVNPIQAGFQSLPASLAEASVSLGKSRLETFWKVLLPNIKPSLLIGTVLNPISATLIFLPIIQALGNQAGYNPVHLGVLSTIVLSVGLVTPPYGICLLIASQIGEVRLGRAMMAVLPICGLTVLVACLSLWFPQIVLGLPMWFTPQFFR